MNKYPIGPSVKLKFNFNLKFDEDDELEFYEFKIHIPLSDEL